MTKEELLSGFESIIGKPDESNNYAGIGISSRTLDTYLGGLGDVKAEDATEAFYKQHVDFLKAMGGQMRHEISDAIKIYKEKNPAPKPDPKPDPKQTDEQYKALMEKLSALEKSNTEMKERMEGADKAKKLAELKSAVIAKMKEQGATDEYVLKNTFKGVVLDDSKSVEELATYYIGEYDKEFKEARGNGATPRQANGGGGDKGALDAFFESKFKQNK